MKSPSFEILRRLSRRGTWTPRELSDPAYRIAGGFASEDQLTGYTFGSSREFYWRQGGVLHNLELHSLESRWNTTRGEILWDGLGRDIRPTRVSNARGVGWFPRERHPSGRRMGRSRLAAKKRLIQGQQGSRRRGAWATLAGSVLTDRTHDWNYGESQWDQRWMTPEITPEVVWGVEARTYRWGVLVRADLNLPPDLKMTSECLAPILADIRANFRNPQGLNPDLRGQWNYMVDRAAALSGPAENPPWVRPA